MGLAVEQRDPDVDHRVAGVHTLLHLRADTLLHAGDELPRHRAADHLVDELESGALRQRLHLDVADRVLAVSAGLLDVAAMAFGFAAERFSQRDPQSDGVHGDAVPVGQRLEHHAGMGLAHAPQHDLMRLRVLLDAQRRVLGGQPPQPDRQLVFVGLGMRPAIAIGSSGSGIVHGLSTSGSDLSDSVSPVSALLSLPIAQMSPATTAGAGRCCLPSGNDRRADAFVFIVVGVAHDPSRR